eukprot:CAMPEP_0181310976 /NCGR_PEP_ID=MMETSP1101-20121128/12884_1 /TAXON_ID=46948 /ORGANISM="Rhodomonas abbreviata, Strain Caron Lab Isolate" /LENGTH=380 /DNA_ID=CAMNT_0023417663 /DNA_START=263 /DNA_END=1405 /DNA_ORIENTATION=+
MSVSSLSSIVRAMHLHTAFRVACRSRTPHSEGARPSQACTAANSAARSRLSQHDAQHPKQPALAHRVPPSRSSRVGATSEWAVYLSLHGHGCHSARRLASPVAQALPLTMSLILRVVKSAVRQTNSNQICAAFSSNSLSHSMDSTKRQFQRVSQAEDEGNVTEMVACAKEVIHLGTTLLDSSSFASQCSIEQEADVKQTIGLTHFKLGDVHETHGEDVCEAGHFQRGLEYLTLAAQARGSLEDWFNVVTVAACAGEVTQSKAAFDQLEELYAKSAPDTKHAFLPWPQILHYVACAMRDGGFHREALTHVERLRDIHQQLRVTDPQFLHARGLLFFPVFLELAKSVIEPLPDVEWDAWVLELAKHVDNEGQRSIDAARRGV